MICAVWKRAKQDKKHLCCDRTNKTKQTTKFKGFLNLKFLNLQNPNSEYFFEKRIF